MDKNATNNYIVNSQQPTDLHLDSSISIPKVSGLLSVKKCINCQMEKEIKDFGVRKKKNNIYIRRVCNNCKKLQKQLLYIKNKDIIKKRNEKWRLNNLEKDKKNKKEYYLKHKQQNIDSAKKWKKNNPEKVKEGNRLYRIKNKEKILLKSKIYNNRDDIKLKKKIWASHPERREKKLIKVRAYRKLHPEKARKYVKNRRKNDINFRLKMQLRHRIYMAIKNNLKGGSAVKDLGCSIPEFKKYIELLWKDGMNWSNWKKNGWHIDHIIPLTNFDLTNREELLKAVHYTNLQPMWAIDNILKSNKIYD